MSPSDRRPGSVALALIVSGALATLGAQELDPLLAGPDAIGDLRVLAEATPGMAIESRETTVSQAGLPDATSSSRHQASVGDGFRVALQSVSAFDPHRLRSGPVYGYEAAYGRSSWTVDGVELDQRSVTIDALVGYAWTAPHGLHLELTPGVGGGIALWRRIDASGATIKSRPAQVEGLLRLALWQTTAIGFQYGLDVRALAAHSRPVFRSTDANTGATTELADGIWQCALGIGIGLGWRY